MTRRCLKERMVADLFRATSTPLNPLLEYPWVGESVHFSKALKVLYKSVQNSLFPILFKILLCQCWPSPFVAGRNLILCSRELGIPGLIENLKTLQTKCWFNMVWNQGKYSSLIRPIYVLCQNIGCLFAFLGLTLQNFWWFSLFFTYFTK